MERNIQNYLNNEFIFENTQLVQSSTDTKDKQINVSLVGQTISDDVIKRLEQSLATYNLEDYTLHVTQNSIADINIDNSDKITIAIQENTISELEAQLAETLERLEELENSIAVKIDFYALSVKAESIFTDLTNCSCGITADKSSEYIVLTANTKRELDDSELQIIENWLRTESGMSNVKLFLNR